MTNTTTHDLISAIKTEADPFRKSDLVCLLRQDYNMQTMGIARELGVTSAAVSHLIRLQRIPEFIRDGYYNNVVPLSHLYILGRLKKETDMMELYERILSESLTAAQTETAVREKLFNVSSISAIGHLTREEIQQYIGQIESELPDFKVTLVQTRIKARLTMEIKGDLLKTSGAIRKLFKQLGD